MMTAKDHIAAATIRTNENIDRTPDIFYSLQSAERCPLKNCPFPFVGHIRIHAPNGNLIGSVVFLWLAVAISRQTHVSHADHATPVTTGRIFAPVHAMRPNNSSSNSAGFPTLIIGYCG